MEITKENLDAYMRMHHKDFIPSGSEWIKKDGERKIAVQIRNYTDSNTPFIAVHYDLDRYSGGANPLDSFEEMEERISELNRELFNESGYQTSLF